MTKSNNGHSIESRYYENNCKRISIKYHGKWIAIKGKRVIGSNKNLIKLFNEVGDKSPLFLNLNLTEVQLI